MTFASYKNYLPTYTKLLIPNDHSHVELQKTNSTKYLGVLIDTHLRWDLHSDLVSKRIRLLINKFKFLRQICTINELKMVYHALVEPHLTYGILGWGGLSDIYYKRMEITQKWIIKIMYRKTITYPTLDLYEIADVFTIRKLYARSLLIHQHSVKPEVPENEQKYELRSISSIPIPKANKTIGLKVFTYLAPLLYRKLPPNIRKNINIGAYKRQIKIWIKTNSKIEWNKFFNRYRHT
ncbi:hypothetical protein WA026_021889 [Henosepilachna vigintioctopunctata]|uniref:Uncharacterized protein n=1 Tax=Henosepilachna vigintioctopunctata TaxID=420089 RepID=A0AAW1URE3_9CUCU